MILVLDREGKGVHGRGSPFSWTCEGGRVVLLPSMRREIW